MNILIINNNTKHLKSLEKLLQQYGSIDYVDNEDLDINNNYDIYDLIVLSGGSGCGTVYRHPERYGVQSYIVRTRSKPIVGICLGAEIIARAYGSSLQYLLLVRSWSRLLCRNMVMRSSNIKKNPSMDSNFIQK